MRKFFVILSAVIASIAAVSCVEENVFEPDSQDNAGKYVELNAGLEVIDTKTHLEEDSQNKGVFNVKWDLTDKISVFDGKDAADFTLKEGSISDDGLSATFMGTIAGAPQYACYPFNQDLVWNADGNVDHVYLPLVQHPIAGSYDSNAALAISKVENNNLTFKNVGAILGVTVNNDNIKAVRLISKSYVPMTGKSKVNANTIEVITDQTADNCVEIQGDFVKGTTYYMVVYPGNHTEGFTIAFFDKDGRIAAFDATKPLNITRNSNVVLANIPEDKVKTKLADGYNLLIDESNLQVGDKIIITSIHNDEYHAFSKNEGKTYVEHTLVTPTYEGLKLQATNDVDILTLETGDPKGFALHGANGYVGPEKSVSSISQQSSWSITKNKVGLFEIYNGSTWLRYNTQSPRFKGYTGNQNLLDATIFFMKGLPTLDEPTVTTAVEGNKLIVSWNSLVANAKDYTVTLTSQVDQSTIQPTLVNPQFIEYEGLAWMTNYELEVVANPSDLSQFNPSRKIIPVEIGQNPNRHVLTAPEITSNVVNRNSVTVEWNSVPNADSYSIVCKEDAKYNKSNITSTSVTINNLPWSKTTNFTLVANPIEGSTEYRPSEPVAFSANIGEQVRIISDGYYAVLHDTGTEKQILNSKQEGQHDLGAVVFNDVFESPLTVNNDAYIWYFKYNQELDAYSIKSDNGYLTCYENGKYHNSQVQKSESYFTVSKIENNFTITCLAHNPEQKLWYNPNFNGIFSFNDAAKNYPDDGEKGSKLLIVPVKTTPEIKLSATEAQIGWEGAADQEITFTKNRYTTDAVTVTPDQKASEWLTAGLAKDKDAIVYTVMGNEKQEARSATITVSYNGLPDQTITINQEAAPAPGIHFEKTQFDIAYTGEEAGVVPFTRVNAAGEVTITVNPEATWLTAKENLTKDGIEYHAGANTNAKSRTATITVTYGGKVQGTINVTQEGKPNTTTLTYDWSKFKGSLSGTIALDTGVEIVIGTTGNPAPKIDKSKFTFYQNNSFTIKGVTADIMIKSIEFDTKLNNMKINNVKMSSNKWTGDSNKVEFVYPSGKKQQFTKMTIIYE